MNQLENSHLTSELKVSWLKTYSGIFTYSGHTDQQQLAKILHDKS